MASNKDVVKVDGRRITVSNLDKVLYPGYKFTKGHVIDYYIRISKWLLPHLKNRPVTLKRFPDGVFGEFFYEKDAPGFTPSWVKTFSVPRRERNGPDIRYILVNDLPTLVWLGNLANLEIHPFLHRVPKIDRPTSIVFDCDPGEGTDVLSCARVAFMLRETLEQLGLLCFAKVSGSKGLQVYVPLNKNATYDVTQPFAKAIAELHAQQAPALIVANMSKAIRRGKIFIDWSQNSDFKTTVGVYSLRAKSHKPLVSMPVRWEELKAAIDAKDREPLFFNPEQALARIERVGDLFAPMLDMKQSLPAKLGNHLSLNTKPARRTLTDAARTPKEARRSRQGSQRRFIVETERARNVKYILRMEIGRSLKSWSLTKAPGSLPSKQRAKAIDDAPPELLDVKKKSAKANTVWEAGSYQLIEGSIRSGCLVFQLYGEKIEGPWRLTRIDEQPEEWIFEKVKVH